MLNEMIDIVQAVNPLLTPIAQGVIANGVSALFAKNKCATSEEIKQIVEGSIKELDEKISNIDIIQFCKKLSESGYNIKDQTIHSSIEVNNGGYSEMSNGEVILESEMIRATTTGSNGRFILSSGISGNAKMEVRKGEARAGFYVGAKPFSDK